MQEKTKTPKAETPKAKTQAELEELSPSGRVISSLSPEEREKTAKYLAAARKALDTIPEQGITVADRLVMFNEGESIRLSWKNYDPRLYAAIVTAAGEWGERSQGVTFTTLPDGDNLLRPRSEPVDATRLITRAAELDRWEERETRHKPTTFSVKRRFTVK